jgi:hypothetical protein
MRSSHSWPRVGQPGRYWLVSSECWVLVLFASTEAPLFVRVSVYVSCICVAVAMAVCVAVAVAVVVAKAVTVVEFWLV